MTSASPFAVSAAPFDEAACSPTIFFEEAKSLSVSGWNPARAAICLGSD
jgi:hypothetical protein